MIKGLEQASLEAMPKIDSVKSISIRNYGSKHDFNENSPGIGVSDMGEYSCDAACDNCHCAAY